MRLLAYAVTFSVSVFLFISGCNDNPQYAPIIIDEQNNGFESFAIAEILTKKCALPECHRGETAQNGLSFESYSQMIKGSMGRPIEPGDHPHKIFGNLDESVYGGSPVIPFDAENSLLYNLITGNVEDAEHRMPYKKEPLNRSQIEILKDWINNGARDFNGNVPYSGPNKVFVCNQWSDEVYVIDTDYKVVARVLDVDVNPNAIDQPHNVQIRDNYYYVSLISAGQFLKVEIATNQIVGRVTGLELPGMIMISPDGKTAYVSKTSTATGVYNIIYVIDTEAMTRKENEINLPVPGLPHAIWLSKDGKTLYVANMTKDRISIVNTDINEVVDDIVLSSGSTVVYEPMHIYLSPDDKYLYVNNRTSSTTIVIDTETKQILKELPIKDHPMQSAVSSDGNKVYVVSHHEPYITEIEKNGTEWQITKEFENASSFHHLYGADLSPDGKYLFMGCSNSTNDFHPHYEIRGKERPSLLCIYDTRIGELVKIIDIGSYSTGMAAREN